MAKPHQISSLTLEPRTETGTTGSQRIRRAGRIPGVVYGHGEATPISVDAKALSELLLSGNKAHIVEATIGGKKDSVLLRRIEAHPISRKALSVDFQRVIKGEAIASTVTLVTVGTPVGVKSSGGVLDVVTHSLEIKGPADQIPDELTVDVSNLDVHQHISAADVPLPAGFSLITPADTVVVSVEVTRAEVSEEASGAVQPAVPATEAPAAG